MQTTNNIQKSPKQMLKKLGSKLLAVLTSILITSAGYSQCSFNAGFTVINGSNGLITVTSTSSGNFNTELYDYGDGTPLTTSTTHTYAFDSTYQICLFVTDSLAIPMCYDTSCAIITITNALNCTVSAGFNVSSINNGIVTIASTSTGNFTSEIYDYGDGTPPTTSNSHAYVNNGFYQICVSTTNNLSPSCSDNFCSSVFVNNAQPCIANASFTYIDNGNGNFSFTNTSTGNPFSANWQFGDGGNSNLNNPNHTFAANGTFNVVLSIFDSICTDQFMTTITVTGLPTPPSCNAGFSMYLDSATNNVIVFNTSTGNNLYYFWSFGDGNSSTLQFPSYTYSGVGPYYLCLSVTDSANSCQSVYCDSVTATSIVYKQTGFTINVVSPIVTSISENETSISDLKTYPNPFSDVVFIELNLSKNTQVETYITDLLGNTVATINNALMSSGNHKLQWNATNLSNGIYLLNIRAEDHLQVKKIVLNK